MHEHGAKRKEDDCVRPEREHLHSGVGAAAGFFAGHVGVDSKIAFEVFVDIPSSPQSDEEPNETKHAEDGEGIFVHARKMSKFPGSARTSFRKVCLCRIIAVCDHFDRKMGSLPMAEELRALVNFLFTSTK